jgi:hypothetical protein
VQIIDHLHLVNGESHKKEWDDPGKLSDTTEERTIHGTYRLG